MTTPAAPKLMKIAGNTGLIALGTGLGQLFILGTTPYLTRVYGLADFGQLALLFTLSNIIVAVGCLRYDLAIPGCQDQDKVPLLALCGVLGTALGALVFLAARLPWQSWFNHPITRLLSAPWIMLLLLMGVAAYQGVGAYLIREGRFGSLAVLRASQGALFSLVAALTVSGLLWAHVISFLAGGFLVGAIILWQAREILVKLDAGRLWSLAKQYRKFPAYSLPGALLDVLGYSACIWIISSSYGLANAGQYSQLQRLIGAPMMLGSLSLAQVMLKQTADELRAGRSLWPLVKSVGTVLLLFAAAFLVCLFLFGPWGLRLFLGARWRVDRYFVCLVASAVFIRACISPLSSVLITTQRFRPAFIWQSCYFLSTLTILRWISTHYGFDGFILGYACHEVVHYSIYFLIIRKVARG